MRSWQCGEILDNVGQVSLLRKQPSETSPTREMALPDLDLARVLFLQSTPRVWPKCEIYTGMWEPSAASSLVIFPSSKRIRGKNTKSRMYFQEAPSKDSYALFVGLGSSAMLPSRLARGRKVEKTPLCGRSG